MKKNKTLRIAVALFLAVILTTIGMTGALAKYIDDFSGASAKVRAGLFRVYLDGETVDPATGNATISLGASLREGDDSAAHNAKTAKKYTGSYYDIIVPGSIIKPDDGFKIVNASEVAVKISLDPATFLITNTGAPLPKMDLLYSVDNGVNWFNDTTLAALLATDTTARDNFLAAFFGTTPAGLVLDPGSNFTTTAGKQSNTLYCDDLNLLILWPFDKATPAAGETNDPDKDFAKYGPGGTAASTSGYAKSNTDAQDTVIGKAQATALLNAATHLTAPHDFKGTTVTDTGDYYVEFSFDIKAVQVD